MSINGFDMTDVMYPENAWDFGRELDEKKH